MTMYVHDPGLGAKSVLTENDPAQPVKERSPSAADREPGGHIMLVAHMCSPRVAHYMRRANGRGGTFHLLQGCAEPG